MSCCARCATPTMCDIHGCSPGTWPSENAAMAKTTKERQEAFRARRAMLDGAQEVRGIFLPPELHAELKKMARQLQERASHIPKSGI